VQWVTTSYVHLDRVATAWLIRSFVDPSAEFTFQDRTLGLPQTTAELPIPFGFPGGLLSAHDEDGTAFAKVLVAYDLTDDALHRLERIVDAGVRHALKLDGADDPSAEETAVGVALDVLGLGLGVTLDDASHIGAAMAIYDGLYTLCRIRSLPADILAQAPNGGPQRVDFYRNALDPK
jgi:hypothetical protein